MFKGVSSEMISRIVSEVKFHFLTFAPGEVIAEAGHPCTHLKCVISGQALLTAVNANRRMTVRQTLPAPAVIAPDFFFGRRTVYPCRAVAGGNSDCGILQFDKADFLKILNTDSIFMYNFLNMLSVSAQRSSDGVMALSSASLEERVAYWIVALTQPGAVSVALECKLRHFAGMLGVSRSMLVSALESMQNRGILTIETDLIRVISRKALVEMIVRHV